MKMDMDKFNETVEQAKEQILKDREVFDECPCIDCKGTYWAQYQRICKNTCPAYQAWMRAWD
jgi:hypothetical protein